ncbi:CxC2 domain-containing protein [Mycena sanguinolenta]|uniref:CxC2 domain-containing protein n=1 Tax=Mycena sanguinolenta TaxID=230812 RepID=A0A8H7DCX1_9AGAR|nr:CxC2 domain-containing protein [Mycena sanguinolenta]
MTSQSHKRKVQRPQLVVMSTVSSVSHTTHNQRRVRTKTAVIGHAGPSLPPANDFWAEDLATNQARGSDFFSYELVDNSQEALADVEEDGITVVVQKAGRNANSDRPLQTCYPKNDEYVEESLRREGRGFPKTYARCAGSRCMDPSRPCTCRECSGLAEWRWLRCSFMTENLNDVDKRWDGTHFVRKRNALQLLGLRVQLGHPPEMVCPFRQPAPHDFFLYDVTGMHELGVDFCGCRTGANGDGPPTERRIQLLRACWWPATITAPNTCATFTVLCLFHKLNCLGKVLAYDFLRGLEMSTNHDGLDKPPVYYAHFSLRSSPKITRTGADLSCT